VPGRLLHFLKTRILLEVRYDIIRCLAKRLCPNAVGPLGIVGPTHPIGRKRHALQESAYIYRLYRIGKLQEFGNGKDLNEPLAVLGVGGIA
jgi:hypothetical protein